MSEGVRGGEPKWLDDAEQRSWRALVVGMNLLTHHLDDDLRRRSGITLTEYEILVRLSERDGWEMRMSQLAGSLSLSRSRTTHTIARMEADELVERQPTTEDGRGVLARMTETGYAVLVQAAPLHVAQVRSHLVDLADTGDLLALGRVMDAVTDDLVVQRPDAEIRSGVTRPARVPAQPPS
jgi:DNA-binding MarR family transcriptional regulator